MLAVRERWEETRAEGGESLGPSLVPGNQRVDAIAIGETEDGCRDPMLVVCGGWGGIGGFLGRVLTRIVAHVRWLRKPGGKTRVWACFKGGCLAETTSVRSSWSSPLRELYLTR